MAKKKKRKYPKLPNGFGSIKKLSGNRTNPYAVHPPTTEFAPNGSPKTPPALCYVPDWYTGFYTLQLWHSGKFDPKVVEELKVDDTEIEYDIVSKIIAAYNNSTRSAMKEKTFSEVYEDFYKNKYERENVKKYSQQTKDSTRAAYKNCASIHDKTFRLLTAGELQNVVDNCPLKHASKELIVGLFHQIYAYAFANNLCDRDYSSTVTVNIPEDDEKGVPFTSSEIDVFWAKKDTDKMLECILIMIYSGFRISEYKGLEINKEMGYFKGGLKTDSGKNRIVPIHHLIYDMIDPGLIIFNNSPSAIRAKFSQALGRIGITGHTPHDCRHTFVWLCDHYKVDSLCTKLMVGHSLVGNVTESVYGHRTFKELQSEVEKIKHW